MGSRRVVVVVALGVLVAGPPAAPIHVRAASSPPLAPTSSKLAPSQLAFDNAVQFRSAMGLDTDPAYVTSVMGDPTASSSAYGVALLPAELADIDARAAIQEKLGPLEDAVAADHHDFAGIWIDQHAHGAVVVELAPGVTVFPTSPAALIPSGATVRLQATQYGRDDLQGIADEISADIPSLRAAGVDVVSVGVDVPSNRVQVGVAGLTATARAALVARYGPALEVVAGMVLDPVSLPTGCTSRTNCRLEGGLNVTNISAWDCTSDFAFRYGDTVYLATAGHCWDGTYYRWYEDSTEHRYIGANFAYSDYSGMSADVLFMTQSATTAKNLIYVSNNDKSHTISDYETNVQQIYGQIACGTGISSGYRCGPVLGTNLTETVPCLGGSCTEYHMWEADFRSFNGDSGGSVFFTDYGLGITDDNSGVHTFYSTVQWIEWVMGAAMCTTSSC